MPNIEISTFASIVPGLYILYLFRIFHRAFRQSGWKAIFQASFPPDSDPAPLLYPTLLPVFISMSLLANSHQYIILVNIMLGLSSLPSAVIPLHRAFHGYSLVHWIITTLPFLVSESSLLRRYPQKSVALSGINPELLFLIFPLHQYLLSTLQFLTTTSLLSTEVQLLVTGLVNVHLLSQSPQAEILKGLLWLGGISIFILCRYVLRWEVVLARVPSWKFRQSPSGRGWFKGFINTLDHKICRKISRIGAVEDLNSDSDDPNGTLLLRKRKSDRNRPESRLHDGGITRVKTDAPNIVPTSELDDDDDSVEKRYAAAHQRRHTFSTFDEIDVPARTTPSGRPKRSMAPGLRSFLSLTAAQAQVRKWAYAIYVYAAVLTTILLPIRHYVSRNALGGNEPFGWALGYLFGNLPSFRLWVVKTNLESWMRIPPLPDEEDTARSCHLGWVEHLRQDTFGEANTRLLICAYCMLVIVVGILLVLRLSTVVEVDTRRKVFHGMMVAMFLPTIYIDPAFAALALSLVLAIFLLLDLFRASQLPPISRPLTHFLAPYVDGRDHKGPVIVSHIFLLIGCAVPLWLSISSSPRTGTPPWEGWDVASRDLGMASGVICVGMGDAAASLVGRRLGRRKWFWGGGKSLEGSIAFASAVFVGIISARFWLVIGGWDRSIPLWSARQWMIVLAKSALAAMGSSFTEAVLTGGNDNVVVPLVLWLLIRGFRI